MAEFTRRSFLQTSAATMALPAIHAAPLPPELAAAIQKIEPYFTEPAKFTDVSRGKPLPHSIPDEKRIEVGLTRETWKLEVVSDPEKPAVLGKQFTKKNDTAFTFTDLLKLGETKSVRFAKVMTCLNMGCPLGMGIFEGVPLRELVWLTKPKEDLRRVHYFGYHNDEPPQIFRSSLSIGRVLEDPDGLPPVILCYKLNGRWLDPKRGAPVRIVVPEAYGFKCVKWLTHLFLSNNPYSNDTYATQNNDVDSPLKTFAATLSVPEGKANAPIPITGYAQVGISGLAKVQVWATPTDKEWPADDPNFTTATWVDGHILPPPKTWGGNFPDPNIFKETMGFDTNTGLPKTWPMRLAKAHWAALVPGLPAGEYTLRCRTIDANGAAQPMPRPFKKSGRCDIEAVKLTVKA